MPLKDLIKKILVFLHLDLTKNMRYDRLTSAILKRELKPSSNCIDVGCHRGEIMDVILRHSPLGQHAGFEPIPNLYHFLQKKYEGKRITLHKMALSDHATTTTFNIVTNAPAYSGLKLRKYTIAHPKIEVIETEVRKMDDVIDKSLKIDFIKIDVEGAELQVLKGAADILMRCKPFVLFEFGKGASEFYNTTADDIFHFFVQCGMQIYTLKGFLKRQQSLSAQQLQDFYQSNSEYYFVAAPATP